jgi:hypothetical protein
MKALFFSLLTTISVVTTSFSQVLPPKEAYPITVKQIHSGHSLTDPLFHPWPGQYRYLISEVLDGDYDSLGKSTIPGSPMFWRWNNEHTLSPVSARYDIDEWELMVITEGIPIPDNGANPPLITPANEHLSLYVNNAWNNGNYGQGTSTLLWSTWTNIDDSNGPWRATLDEYESHWEEMMDYANANRPSGATPVYMIPGHRMMARLYDDIQNDLVPGITNINQFFSDNIHVNDIGAYAVAMIHYACIFNQSPVGLTNNLYSPFDVSSHSIPSPELALYLQTMIWDVVTSYSRTGISIPLSISDASSGNENINTSDPLNDVLIFPNPAHDHIRIEHGGESSKNETQYAILNSLGDIIISSNDSQINISSLIPGCYIIKIGSAHKKFIKY